jgi:aminoglycoside phosphotransferase (APT) family kinase protein
MSPEKMHVDQLDIDEPLVRRLLAGQFPQWADLPIERVESAGTENAIYRLGDDLAIRLPYRAAKTRSQVDRDHRWLPLLEPHLPLPIPVPLAKGAPAAGYPAQWSVCRWLPGEEAELDRLADPSQAARDLAMFIHALQQIDPAGGPAPGDHNFYRGVPLAARDGYTRAAITKSAGLVDGDALTAAWERDLKAAVWQEQPVWIHGDLAPDNLLAIAGRLSGVIDWGGMAVGDPAIELLPAWNLFEGESRLAFRDALDVDDATWARGRGLALSVAAVALPYYLDTNPVIVRWSRHVIDEVLADHQRG